MSFLDQLLFGIRRILDSSDVEQPRHDAIKFTGAGVAVSDSADATVVTIDGAAGDLTPPTNPEQNYEAAYAYLGDLAYAPYLRFTAAGIPILGSGTIPTTTGAGALTAGNHFDADDGTGTAKAIVQVESSPKRITWGTNDWEQQRWNALSLYDFYLNSVLKLEITTAGATFANDLTVNDDLIVAGDTTIVGQIAMGGAPFAGGIINLPETAAIRWTDGGTIDSTSNYINLNGGAFSVGSAGDAFVGAQLDVTTYVAIGSDPADTGGLRLSNGSANGIWFEASPAGTDVGIYVDASEALHVGVNAQSGGAGIRFYNGATEVCFVDDSGFRPSADAAFYLGASSTRWIAGHFSEFLAVGTNPASSGAVRLANNLAIDARNAANSADVTLIWVDGGNALRIGDNNSTGVVFGTPTGTFYQFNVNDVSQLLVSSTLIDCLDNEIRTTGFLTIGATPATTGDMRVKNGWTLYGRNAANDANRVLFDWSSGDNLQIGGANNGVSILTDDQFQVNCAGGANPIYVTSTDAFFGNNSQVVMTDTGLAFFNGTPSAKSTGWSVSNHTSDKVLDETGDTLAQVANVLGTLITELLSKNLIGA